MILGHGGPETNPEIVPDLVNEAANVMATRLSNQLKSWRHIIYYDVTLWRYINVQKR